MNHIDLDIAVYSVASACEGKHWLYKGSRFESKLELNQILKDDGVDDSACTECREPSSLESLHKSLTTYTENIINRNDCDYQGYISGQGNFRYDIATILPYKGKRVGLQKPYHYDNARQFLVDTYGAIVSEGMEADDLIGLSHDPENDIISTLDKDLNCIPGLHDNWVKDAQTHYNELQADAHFYQQVLMGDLATDNIPGLYGVGAKSKLLTDVASMTCEEDMFNFVRDQYQCRFGSYVDLFLKENMTLLWILQKREPAWKGRFQ